MSNFESSISHPDQPMQWILTTCTVPSARSKYDSPQFYDMCTFLLFLFTISNSHSFMTMTSRLFRTYIYETTPFIYTLQYIATTPSIATLRYTQLPSTSRTYNIYNPKMNRTTFLFTNRSSNRPELDDRFINLKEVRDSPEYDVCTFRPFLHIF